MFWEVFYNLCKENNTTPTATCIKLGFSNATATKWKKGSVPSIDAVKKIAEHFNVSADSLLGNNQKNKPAEFGELDEKKLELFNMVKSLDDEKFKVALKFFRSLKDE